MGPAPDKKSLEEISPPANAAKTNNANPLASKVIPLKSNAPEKNIFVKSPSLESSVEKGKTAEELLGAAKIKAIESAFNDFSQSDKAPFQETTTTTEKKKKIMNLAGQGSLFSTLQEATLEDISKEPQFFGLALQYFRMLLNDLNK